MFVMAARLFQCFNPHHLNSNLIMSSTKFYFRRIDDELCFTKEYHLQNMNEGQTELEVFEATPVNDESFFYCKAVGEMGETGNCGFCCDDYSPCNGKNGRCRHKGKCYEPEKL